MHVRVSEQISGSYESIDNTIFISKLLIVERDKVYCTWNRDRNREGGGE